MKKDKNPYILSAVLFGILTIFYIVLTVWAVACDKPVWLVFIYVVLAVGEGILTGEWIGMAKTYKEISFLRNERYTLLHENFKLRKMLIDLKEKQNNDGQ